MLDFRCPNCGSMRDINLGSPCNGCKSRKFMGSYLYPHEQRSFVVALAIIVLVVTLAAAGGLLFVLSFM